MRSAKSISSIPNNGDMQIKSNSGDEIARQRANQISHSNKDSSTSPICRCRVMYLGSSVPHITKDGLQGIQEPLRELYPDKANLSSGNAGIDSWLSVWSNGILIENVDETGRETKRFFKIDALHYCAAVKYVPNPIAPQTTINGQYSTLSNSQPAGLPKFLPLDSPYARQVNSNPPIFASILRRTTGIKVLECHAFICKREAAANALVRCCFHAYADTMYAKQIGADVSGVSSNQAHQDENDGSNKGYSQDAESNGYSYSTGQPGVSRRSKSIAALNESDPKQNQSWQMNGDATGHYESRSEYDGISISRRRDEHNGSNLGGGMNHHQIKSENLRRQQNLSKSMHQLNQNGLVYHNVARGTTNDLDCNLSTSASCTNSTSSRQDSRLPHQVPHKQPPFFNPYAARVPSYPPQSVIDTANNGGTLRSVKSMAANSIASTLLRSKKHAKAMSIAQLNQDKVKSFHQPHSNANTLSGSMLLPPVPPMFLPHLQNRPIFNGSQTMKVPSRSMVPIVGPPTNYETMTPKEIKKMLKKSAKYGLDPNKLCENGLPLMPMRPPHNPMIQPLPSHLAMSSGSGTMMSQSMYSDICNNNMLDLAAMHGLPRPPMPEPQMDPNVSMKPILVKPNAEFLKSKAGKKWVKQQKEFKKLLPPHLDGLPIIFGPPPPEALEPVCMAEDGPAISYMAPPLPMMDSSGYYNPNQIYHQNGRASATSTLLRYSPHSQMIHDNGMNPSPQYELDYIYRNQMGHHNGHMQPAPPNMTYVHRGEHMNDASSYIGNHCNMNQQVRNDLEPRRHSKNHMVEQSVISLGDENDYDDEEEDHDPPNEYYEPGQVHPDARSHPKRSKSNQSLAKSNQHNDQANNFESRHPSQSSQAYEQINLSNDDQSSYSSGIYKRGHINERAFSYSIQQEHKSGVGNNSDAEYGAQNEMLVNEAMHEPEYHQPSRNQYHSSGKTYYRNVPPKEEFYNDRLESHNNTQVNELTARLENQLNMKSFANSHLKSHN